MRESKRGFSHFYYKINYQRKRIIHLLEKIIKQGIDITTENWDVKMEEYKNLKTSEIAALVKSKIAKAIEKHLER